MDDEPELREKVTRSLPPRLAGLLESGLVAIELRSSKLPTNHALTVYRKGDFRFTILLRSETVRAAGEAAIRGLIRHELGHIFLGHFADSHLECQRLCNTLAEEAEVNYYVPREELMAIDAVATRLLQEFAAQALGEDAARILAAHFGSLERLSRATYEELVVLPEIGPKIAVSVTGFFAQEENRRVLDKLVTAGVNTREVREEEKEKPLAGKVFVLTGTLERFTRKEAEEIIARLGGRVSSSVSRHTDYVVVGANPGSKYEKALSLGVPIIREDEFIKLISQ